MFFTLTLMFPSITGFERGNFQTSYEVKVFGRATDIDLYLNRVKVGYVSIGALPDIYSPDQISIIHYRLYPLEVSRALGVSEVALEALASYLIKHNDQIESEREIHVLGYRGTIYSTTRRAGYKDLEKYVFDKLEIFFIFKDSEGNYIGIFPLNIVNALKKVGLRELSFTWRYRDYLLTLKPTLMDPGWLEIDLLEMGTRRVGYARIIGDPTFNSSHQLYFTFYLDKFELIEVTNLTISIDTLDLKRNKTVYLNFTLSSADEIFIPGTVSLERLGVGETPKKFKIKNIQLKVGTPIAYSTLNATEYTGTISLIISPRRLNPVMEVLESREIGFGWLFWHLKLFRHNPSNRLELNLTSLTKFKPIFVKAIAVENRSDVLPIYVFAFFNETGGFKAKMSVSQTDVENRTGRTSVNVDRWVIMEPSFKLSEIEVEKIEGEKLSVKIWKEMRSLKTAIIYRLIPESKIPEYQERVSRLESKLKSLSHLNDYIEFTLPLNLTLKRFDFAIIRYHYSFKPLNGSFPVKMEKAFEIREDGFLKTFEPLGFKTPTKLRHLLPRTFEVKELSSMKVKGMEEEKIGHVVELCDANGKPMDFNLIKELKIRFYNVEEVSLTDVSVLIYRTQGPIVETPYKPVEALEETFEEENLKFWRQMWNAIPIAIILIAIALLALVALAKTSQPE